jgi:hypothetical protein
MMAVQQIRKPLITLPSRLFPPVIPELGEGWAAITPLCVNEIRNKIVSLSGA